MEKNKQMPRVSSQSTIIPVPNCPRIIVIGNGPVGVRTVQELIRMKRHALISIYGNEPWEPYNRAGLSSLLAGNVSREHIENRLEIPTNSNVRQFHNCPIDSINKIARYVTDYRGNIQFYSHLVIATGSSARIPNIPNIGLHGVFTFRDLNDTQRLLARITRSRRAVVVGGGLLGLETAVGLNRAHTAVSVVNNTTHLMSRQLDFASGELLAGRVKKLGISVILSDGVIAILGDHRVEGVKLRSGRVVECDTVVLAAGIVPNIDLAKLARLKYNRGIWVNERMQTSNPFIYAVGECAEFRNDIYGFVGPGLEQAAIVASNITGGSARYNGSQVAMSLKVVNSRVFSMGCVGENEYGPTVKKYIYTDPEKNIYRLLVIHRFRIIGVIALGDWPELNQIRDAYEKRRRTGPWRLYQFKKTGHLWQQHQSDPASYWPVNATACNFTGVTRGRMFLMVGSIITVLIMIAVLLNTTNDLYKIGHP